MDPDDEDKPDLTVFGGLEMFLDSDMTEEERSHFLEVTTPSMVHKALQLKQLKPAGGLHFSLQQQGERLTQRFYNQYKILHNNWKSTMLLKCAPTMQRKILPFFEYWKD